jgi:hypothetical protein
MAIVNAVLLASSDPQSWSAWQDVPIPNPATVNLIALQVLNNTAEVQIALGPVGQESIWDTIDKPTGGVLVPTFNGRVAMRMIGMTNVNYRGAILV